MENYLVNLNEKYRHMRQAMLAELPIIQSIAAELSLNASRDLSDSDREEFSELMNYFDKNAKRLGQILEEFEGSPATTIRDAETLKFQDELWSMLCSDLLGPAVYLHGCSECCKLILSEHANLTQSTAMHQTNQLIEITKRIQNSIITVFAREII